MNVMYAVSSSRPSSGYLTRRMCGANPTRRSRRSIMGVVVNKSFNKLEKDIAKKYEKLLEFLIENNGNLYDKWTYKKNKMYSKLAGLCDSLAEEVSYLDEIDVPEFEEDK